MRVGLLAVVSMAAIGCGGGWTIIKQAQPSPFKPDSTFAVAPATWEDLKVGKKTEAEWLAEKDEKAKMSHEGDKQLYANEFASQVNTRAKGLKIAGEGSNYVIKSHVYWMEPGYYAMISHGPAQVKVRVDVIDGGGAVIDQIEFIGQGDAVMPFNPIPRATVGERLKYAAHEVAAKVTKYLRERAGVKD